MAIDMSACYKRNDVFVYREVAGEAVLVPIRSNAADLDNLYVLNEVGSRIWSLLDGGRTLEEIVSLIVDEYEVSAGVARSDAVEFLQQLGSFGGVVLR
jgi:hypothetical protein